MAVPTRALGLALLLVLAPPLLWLSLLRAPALRVDVGEWGDHAYLSGVNAPERSARESYRWTTGQAELVLPNLGGHFRLLRLRLHGWRPAGLPAPRLSISADGRLLTSVVAPPQLQTYELLLPYDAITPVRRITCTAICCPTRSTSARSAWRSTGSSCAHSALQRLHHPGSWPASSCCWCWCCCCCIRWRCLAAGLGWGGADSAGAGGRRRLAASLAGAGAAGHAAGVGRPAGRHGAGPAGVRACAGTLARAATGADGVGPVHRGAGAAAAGRDPPAVRHARPAVSPEVARRCR
ncbi:MAG: hypothetical protein U0Z44_20735 [Kouleothrix sp.]